MPARKPWLRRLRVPSPGLGDIPVTQQANRLWFRVHQSKFPAKFFSLNGSHRFSDPKCRFAVLYLATDMATCLFERFGDAMYDRRMAIANSLWIASSVSCLRVPRLKICDLTRPRTLSALRVDLAALMN